MSARRHLWVSLAVAIILLMASPVLIAMAVNEYRLQVFASQLEQITPLLKSYDYQIGRSALIRAAPDGEGCIFEAYRQYYWRGASWREVLLRGELDKLVLRPAIGGAHDSLKFQYFIQKWLLSASLSDGPWPSPLDPRCW